jgi:hypothetical protein
MNLRQTKLNELLGYKDSKQARKYRQAIVAAGLLTVGRAYSAGAFAKRHLLTRAAKNMFDEAKAQSAAAV